MANEWTGVALAELSSDISYGYTESASIEQVGPRFLRITDIQNGVVNWTDVPFCPITPENYAKYKLHDGDIVIARTGNSTGENFLYQGGQDAVFASYLIRFRIDPRKADPRFVWYNLRSRAWWDFIDNSKTGSAQAGANAKVLGTFPVCCPPLPEQHIIADILGSLDDKIELNREMNRTLEAMARAIFKAWFVDFEPVKAKAGGATSFRGMPEAVFHQLPAGFTETELGQVPEGWRYVSIGDLVHVVGGATPSTKEEAYWKGGIHAFCTPKDMSRLEFPVLLDTQRKITEHGLKKISSGQLSEGAVLLSSRAPIGYLAIAETPVSVNQGIIAMECGKVSNLYILFWARESMGTIKAHAGGSTFAEISKRNFRPLPVLMPSLEMLSAFDANVAPLYRRIVSNLRESKVLAQTRDALLPELIAGKIRL